MRQAAPERRREPALEASHALVRAFFAAVASGDLPDDLLTPDMSGWTTTQGDMSKADYQKVIRLLAQITAEPLAFTIDAITAEEDRAVAEVRSTGKLIDRTDYANTYVFTFRLREGRIARVAEHFNTLVVHETIIPVVRTTLAKRTGLEIDSERGGSCGPSPRQRGERT